MASFSSNTPESTTSASSISPDHLDVTTEQGTVRGWRGAVADHWTAIPYANELNTTRDLFSPPSAPATYEGGALLADRNRRGSRHTLSVATPIGACHTDATRPVIVFIHGGRYEMGEADSMWYRGANFARDNCVYVAINYRLRFEGFLPLADEESTSVTGHTDVPAQSEHSKETAFRGLEDIFHALEWVQKNIARFGGDPHNVTLMGQSAGGALTHVVLSDPRSKGLVHRGVCLSMGLPRAGWPTRIEFARKVLGGPLTLDHVSGLSQSDVKDAYDTFAAKYPADCAVGPYPWDPSRLRDVPMIMGSMRDEFVRTPIAARWDRLGLEGNPVQKLMAKAVTLVAAQTMGLGAGVASKTNWLALPKAVSEYRRYSRNEKLFRPLGHIVGDSTIRRFVTAALDARDSHAPTWAYEFHSSAEIATPGAHHRESDAQHCGDLPLVFDDLGSVTESVEEFCGEDAQQRLQPLATRFHQVVVDFAHGKEPDWPRYESDGEKLTKLFDMNDCSESVASDTLREVRRFFPFAD